MRETRKGRQLREVGNSGLFVDDRVDHSLFGSGTILEVDDRYTMIAFDESGTRKFVTSMVKLAPSDTPAPPPRAPKKKASRKRGTNKSGTVTQRQRTT